MVSRFNCSLLFSTHFRDVEQATVESNRSLQDRRGGGGTSSFLACDAMEFPRPHLTEMAINSSRVQHEERIEIFNRSIESTFRELQGSGDYDDLFDLSARIHSLYSTRSSRAVYPHRSIAAVHRASSMMCDECDGTAAACRRTHRGRRWPR